MHIRWIENTTKGSIILNLIINMDGEFISQPFMVYVCNVTYTKIKISFRHIPSGNFDFYLDNNYFISKYPYLFICF